jgi:hypothetical protein
LQGALKNINGRLVIAGEEMALPFFYFSIERRVGSVGRTPPKEKKKSRSRWAEENRCGIITLAIISLALMCVLLRLQRI